MQKESIYAEITNRIVDSLEDGAVPWAKPWRNAGPVRNAVTNRPYRGINILLLSLTACSNGFTDPRWLTLKNANALGGNIRKGEKGTRIVFWKFLKTKQESPNTDEDRVIDADFEGDQDFRVIPLARMYTVFNVQQCEGIELAPLPGEGKVVGESNETAEQLLVVADIQYGGDQAAYSHMTDQIMMPIRAAFDDLDQFYGTAFHEITHWTGHPSRFNRLRHKRFGDQAYAFEEMVAEIGAAFLCAEAMISFDKMRHPGYIEPWLKILKADSKAIFLAASQAQKAADFVLGQAGLLGEESVDAASC